MATEDEVMAIEEEDMAIEEDHMAIEDENTDNMRAEEQVEKVSVWSGNNARAREGRLPGQPGIVVVSGVDSDTATMVSLQSPNLSSSSSGWNPNITLDERLNEEKLGSLRVPNL